MQDPASQKEIFFPAHIIGIIASEMWTLGYIDESERLLFSVMHTIQKQCLVSTTSDSSSLLLTNHSIW